MDIDGGGGHKSMLVHQTDAVIVGRSPYACMGRYRQIEVARSLECGLLRKCGVAGNIESELHAQHISTPVDAPPDEIGKLGGLCPFPGRAKQVAVREDEPARDCFKGIDRSICMRYRLQAVRPVHGCRDASIHGLKRGQQIASINILRAKDFAPVEIVELEIVCERPVGAEPT